VVLYAGRIHPEKGLELLVQAVRVLAQRREHVSLRLIGPLSVAEGGAGPSYARHLRDLAGEARIELQEPIYDRRRLCGEFHRATCFCYPSVAERGESFGVAPLEAMASGLPPVVSALACFQEFVTHGETGLIFDHRASDPVERLAESLESVLFNDALRIRMKEAGTRRARDFSTPRIAEMFLEDFEQLLSRGRQV
jgi:glycosyltransferase involved in cell wall biosynthesis